MSLLHLIAGKNYIVVNKGLIKVIGLEETIVLSELASEYGYWEEKKQLEDGYFYSTIENVELNTSLNEYKQRKAFKSLQDKNIIDVKVKGIPAKRYIKINEEQVLKILNNKFFNNLSTSSLKIKELELKKLKGNNNNINSNKNINNKYNICGVYKRIKLTEKEYKKLVDDFGEDFIKKQIELLDEYVESNNNKNKYSNFNLVLRKSIREHWFQKNNEILPKWFNKEIKKEEIDDDTKRIVAEIEGTQADNNKLW